MNNDIRGPIQPNRPGQTVLPEATSLREDPPVTVQAGPNVTNLHTDPDADPIEIATQAMEAKLPEAGKRIAPRRVAGLGLLVVAIVIASWIVFAGLGRKNNGSVSDNTPDVATQSVSLGTVAKALTSSTPPAASSLTVNGQLNINGTAVITPSSQPTNSVAGQLYYDQALNVMYYYNGTAYVPMKSGASIITNVNNSKITNVAGPTNITNVTNSYVTNTTTGSSAAGTTGSIAMFATPTTLASSMLTQNGTTLSTGSGVESVNLGSLAGASTTAIQAGTSNLNILTGPQSGSTGNITIQTGDSTTTASGNVSIDTGNSTLSGTVVTAKDFEDGIDNMVDAIYNGNSTTAQTNAQAESGTHSLAVSVGSFGFPTWAIGSDDGNPPYQIPAVAGHTYAFQAWVRADTNSDLITGSAIWSNDGYGGGGEISQVNFGSATDVTTGWRKIAGILTAPVGAVSMGLYFSADDAQTIGEVHYFDNITVTDLSNSSSAAAITIGATNAQVITIGNTAMFAPTSIYGGGVNVNAGTGILSLSAANIAAASGGANFTTTSGALDITAATTSTWRVAASGGTGGDLNIASGAGGGTGDGGNLNLSSGAVSGTGNTGNIAITTPANAASTGTITLQSGDSTTTAAGNVSIDTGNSTVSGTVVDDKTFDDGATDFCGTGNDDMGGWFGVNTSVSNAQAHSGANSLAATTIGGASWSIVQNDNCSGIPVTPGHHYSFSAWVRADTTPELIAGSMYFGGIGANPAPFTSQTDTTTGWIEMTGSATAPAGATTAWPEFSGPFTAGVETHYFDDIELIDTSSGSVLSQLNLGAVNAQGVTLGNNNEVNATNIYGGGINLQAGQGNLNLAGGVDTITSFTNINLDAAGSTYVVPQTDSGTAFQIQSAEDAPLLTADTTNMTVTVTALIVTANLTVDGHIITGGNTPAIVAGPAACTSPTVSVAGTDTTGTITITTGTGCSSGGTMATVTFASAFGAAPHVILTPGSPISQTLGAYVDDSTISTTSFDLGTNATPLPTQTFKWNYWAAQ
jgi:hypothetical protein